MMEALEKIAKGSRETIGACDWCGESGLPPRCTPDCPTTIARTALDTTENSE